MLPTMSITKSTKLTRDFKIVEDLTAGLKITEIARKYEVSVGTVAKVGKTFGISRAPQLTKALENKIVRAYKRGTSTPSILDRYGISQKTLYNVIERRKIPLRSKGDIHFTK